MSESGHDEKKKLQPKSMRKVFLNLDLIQNYSQNLDMWENYTYSQGLMENHSYMLDQLENY